MAQEKIKLKGIYLVPDPAMMKPNFGPSEHIHVGLSQLQKYFQIELLILGEYDFNNESATYKANRAKLNKNGFVGLLRDLKLLVNSNKGKKELIQKIKEIGDIDFIYERGQYLDFRGVQCARKLGISHFYEVNWINFLGIRQFYYSWFNPIAKRLEEWSYTSSNLNFIVGSQNALINLDRKKVRIIQNGMYENVFEQNVSRKNEVGEKIKICYVANLMKHHRFDIFIDALKIFKNLENIELHCIGYNFEEHLKNIPDGLNYVFHGPIKQNELKNYLAFANVGIITGGPSYSSFMKLFEYAAYKLAVICPDLENVKQIFTDQEVLFFKNNSSRSLASVLELIVKDKKVIANYGQKIFEKSKEKYTWENIYQDIASDIMWQTIKYKDK